MQTFHEVSYFDVVVWARTYVRLFDHNTKLISAEYWKALLINEINDSPKKMKS